jgi:broad specificity phosphatase PhoE
MTLILLVRHGQTELNRAERFRGRSEVPLNEAGLAQAEAAARRIASGWKPMAIYSSPLKRAIQTAEVIARVCGLSYQAESGLIDIDFGAWQEVSVEEAIQRWPQEIDNWRYRPHLCHIPGGESLDAVRKRGMEALRALVNRHPGDTIVLVGHTVVNQVLLLGILGLGNERFWHLRQGNSAINVIEARNDDFVLVAMNDTAHLSGLPA